MWSYNSPTLRLRRSATSATTVALLPKARALERGGADYITFHLEAAIHVHRTLCLIRSLGKKAGLAIVPSTPAAALSEVLQLCDLVLVMTVNPGFGGQSLIAETLKKVRTLSQMRTEGGWGVLRT